MIRFPKQIFQKAPKCLLILFLLATSLAFIKSHGTSDVNFWEYWVKNLDEHGIINGFQKNHEVYPPFCSIILYFFFMIFFKTWFWLFCLCENMHFCLFIIIISFILLHCQTFHVSNIFLYFFNFKFCFIGLH